MCIVCKVPAAGYDPALQTDRNGIFQNDAFPAKIYTLPLLFPVEVW